MSRPANGPTSDAVIVGSGPNGLAAAVTLARAGLDVEVVEARDEPGGGAATRELTLPGYHHDVASAVHPMALVSPFFREFDLASRIELAIPEVSYAHPLPGRTVAAYRDLERTVDELGVDGRAYRRLFQPLIDRLEAVTETAMSPLVRIPRHPVAASVLAAATADQGTPLWNRRFREEAAPALISGSAAHTISRHPRLPAAGAGLLLTVLAHTSGWPVPIGGSQAITDAMIADLQAHGGRLRTGVRVHDLDEVRASTGGGRPVTVLNLSAAAAAGVGARHWPQRYLDILRRQRFGAGVCKLDAALSGPIPWTDERLRAAPTIHLGGTRAQIAAGEKQVMAGRVPDHPYVLLVQPSVIDPTRAPAGQAVLWAYTHVPFGCPVPRGEAILDAIEAYAPGVRDLVSAQRVTTAVDLPDQVSTNFAGGDFASGALDLAQLIRRPVLSPTPWRTPVGGVYLASGSTVPGPAVHGMAGYQAALTALADLGLPAPSLAPGD